MRHNKAVPVLVAVFTPLSVLCSPGCGTPGDHGAAAARDSAGVHIVEYGELADVSVLPFPGSFSRQIGVAEGNPQEEFGLVAGATRLGDGTIVVADAMASQIRAFGPNGSVLWTAGSDGAGPGDFRNIGFVQEHRDSIAVYDRALRRVTILTATGQLGRTVTLNPMISGELPAALVVLPSGSMIVQAQETITPQVPEGIHRLAGHIATYSPDGRMETSITTVSGREWIKMSGESGGTLAPRTFGADGLVSGSVGGIATSETERFEVRIFDPSTASLRSIIRSTIPSRRLAKAHLDLYRRHLAQDNARDARSARDLSLMNGMDFPDHFPSVEWIHLDRSARLWLRAYRAPWESRAPVLLFDENGAVIGRVPLPADERLLEAGNGYLLSRWADEFGVHYVRIYEWEGW